MTDNAAEGVAGVTLDVERLCEAFTRVQPGLYGMDWPRDDPDDFQFISPREHAKAIAREYAALSPTPEAAPDGPGPR